MACFSFLCSDRCRLDAAALKTASAGLHDISTGYRKLADIDWPQGAAHVLATLRKTILELEGLVDQAKPLKTQALPHPMDYEQRRWEREYPEGGVLLRQQSCMASDGSGEWFAGVLCISDEGLVFDAGCDDDDGGFYTGFLPWQEIQAVENSTTSGSGVARDVRLALSGGPSVGLTSLQLQLSISKHSEWLKEFWLLYAEQGAQSGQQPPATSGAGGPADLPGEAEAFPTLSDERGAFLAHDLPKDAEPMWTGTLDGVSFAAVRRAFVSDDWPMTSFLQKHKRFDMTMSRWAASKCVAGTQVRKATMRMGLPTAPWALQQVLNLPQDSRTTVVYRLTDSPEALTLTIQTRIHDVLMGDSFCIVEYLRFSEAPSGGLYCCKHAQVVWVKELSWSLRAAKGFVEVKCQDATKCTSLMEHLSEVLLEPSAPSPAAAAGAPPLEREDTTTFRTAASEKEVFVDTSGPSSLPASAAPAGEDPVWSDVLRGISMDAIGRAFESNDWPLVGVWQKQECTEIKLSRWVESSYVPGTLVRKVRYRMPLPQDLPWAIARMVNMPKESMLTSAFRWKRTEEELVLVSEVLTEEVMFGPNFRVIDITTFREAGGGGGVLCKKFINVVWVTDLPWSAKSIKEIIEKKSRQGGVDNGKLLAEHLLEVLPA